MGYFQEFGVFFLPSTTTPHLVRPETIQISILEMFKSQNGLGWKAPQGSFLSTPLGHRWGFHQASLHSYTWQLIRMDILSIHEKPK